MLLFEKYVVKAPFVNASWNKWLKPSISCANECSFLSWFCDCEQKDDMADIHDELAELIKDDLWSNPLIYFNSEEPDEEDADDEADDEEKDEDDSEEEDDEEGDDEEGN